VAAQLLFLVHSKKIGWHASSIANLNVVSVFLFQSSDLDLPALSLAVFSLDHCLCCYSFVWHVYYRVIIVAHSYKFYVAVNVSAIESSHLCVTFLLYMSRGMVGHS